MEKNKVVACSKCHRLFNTVIDTDTCPECNIILEQIYKNVKKYIRSNSLAGIAEVSLECNISTKQILKWIREERLIFAKDSEVGIPCLNCGITIRSGKYCIPCTKKVVNTLSSAYIKPVEDEINDHVVTKKSKMHSRRFLDK